MTKQVSLWVSDEIYGKKKESGIKWAKIIEFGLEAAELRLKVNELKAALEKMQKANNHLQQEVLRLNDLLEEAKK